MLLPYPVCKTAPIAIYDSGVGGLTIAKALQAALPGESFHYIGDTKHLPYGNQTTAALGSYITQVVNFCLEKRYKLLVMACNTAAVAASYFASTYFKGKAMPTINVVDPVITALIHTNAYKHIGLIGTTYTVTHGSYTQRLQAAGIALSALATPLLAPMVEAYFCNGNIDHFLLHTYLSQLADLGIEALIPACTHYLFLVQDIQFFFKKHYQKTINIIDVAALTVLAVKEFLTTYNLLNNSNKKASNCFMSTALTPAFTNATQQLFEQTAIAMDLPNIE